MSIELISVLILAAMIGLMILGLPLAWSIGAVAVALTLVLFDPQVLVMLVSRVFDMSLNYTLMVVPLFVLWPPSFSGLGWPNSFSRRSMCGPGVCGEGWPSARSSQTPSWPQLLESSVLKSSHSE